ncbi:MAG: LegC family aminotransferase [Chloroflexi bacterium]|nr:LegC family aminotransferase [Chloroflexota bacterium]
MQSKISVSPLIEPIPLSAPELRGNEWKYVKECLDTNWVSSAGAFVDQFERMLADYVGAEHAVATCNGTAALHTALLVAGVQPDDEVLVSTLTFIAPANAIRYVGAWPVFMDAEPDYWQMDAQKVTEFLDKWCRWENGRLVNRATGRRIKALMPVHILGHPCDMTPLLEVARKYELTVIEDATESLGARYNGQKVGTLGDIACFSFNGNKLLTTGGGGMIVTDNEKWAERARYLTTQAKDDSYEYIHQEIGYNYRLTNIQAALGCAQLEQINDYIAAKRLIAAMYEDSLGNLPGITLMKEADWAFSAFWMYTVLVDEAEYGTNCRGLLDILRENGVQTRPLWQPLHRSPAHRGAQAWRCSEADRLYEQALSLPCSVGISESELARVAELVAINGGR